MARSLQIFKEKLVEAEQLHEKQKQAEVEAEMRKKAMLRQLANEFEGAVGGRGGNRCLNRQANSMPRQQR